MHSQTDGFEASVLYSWWLKVAVVLAQVTMIESHHSPKCTNGDEHRWGITPPDVALPNMQSARGKVRGKGGGSGGKRGGPGLGPGANSR